MASFKLTAVILIVGCLSTAFAAPFDHTTLSNDTFCKDLSPRHPGTISAPITAAPYTLEATSDNLKHGQTITVALKGLTDDDTFKGFMIQARPVLENGEVGDLPIGEFVVADDDETSALLFCDHAKSSIIQKHIPQIPYKSVEFVWKAPTGPDAPKAIKFRVTVVKSYAVFWVGVLSSEIKLDE